MSRALFACLSLALVASLPFGAASAQSQLRAGTAPHEKVFLLCGFTNVLSPEIDQLAQELKEKSIETEVANHGAISNVDLKNDPGLGHVSATAHPSMQKQVIHGVLAANTRCG
jgi:hypothetical protein